MGPRVPAPRSASIGEAVERERDMMPAFVHAPVIAENSGKEYWADEVIATKRNEPNPTAVHIRFVTSLDGVLSRPVRDIGQGRSKT